MNQIENTFKTGISFQKIDSPLSAFNNVLIQITNKLSMLFIGETGNISFNNQLYFTEDSIVIANKIKLSFVNKKTIVEFFGKMEFCDNRFGIIEKFIENKLKIKEIFNQYMFMVSQITFSIPDYSISEQYVHNIYQKICTGDVNSSEYFIVPFKNKLLPYENSDPTLAKIYNRYSYIITFNVPGKRLVNYSFKRVLSSVLSQSKSIENIKFEEIEILKKETLSIDDVPDFLSRLFYYGEIKL